MDKSLRDVLRVRAKGYIFAKLYKYDGDKAKAAKALGIGLSTLYRKMVDLKIKWDR